MTLPFYKLQLAGNGILLVDMQQLKGQEGKSTEELITYFDSERQSLAAHYMCNSRFGIGANAIAFLYPDNQVRVFNKKGNVLLQADDALLCVARYAYDIGRAKNRTLQFNFAHEQRTIDVLGAHEFRLSIGSAFSLFTGEILNMGSTSFNETIELKDIRASFSAIHLREDCLVAQPTSKDELSWKDFFYLSQQAFPQKAIVPVFSKVLTRDSLLIYSKPRLASSSCAAAASAACSSIFLGECNPEILVIFKTIEQDDYVENAIAHDTDNSRRLAIEWDSKSNDFAVIGTGGYVFEGKYDLPFNT